MAGIENNKYNWDYINITNRMINIFINNKHIWHKLFQNKAKI